MQARATPTATPVEADLKSVEISQGTIRYRDTGAAGASGETILFVHGLLVDGRLWRKVTPLLEGSHRCIVPDLPLGSHKVPLKEGTDFTPPGMAALLAELIEKLDLGPVTVVGNDSGGALSQILAANRPELVKRLILTPCDAFEVFPPAFFKPLLAMARVPGGVNGLAQAMRIPAVRRSPPAFGWLIKHDPDDQVLADWTRPSREDAAIRRDTVAFMKGAHPKYTLDAAEKLASFDKPAMVVWATDDKFFKAGLGKRLAAKIPGARLEWVDDSYAFIAEDQPERLAHLIEDFISSSGQPAAPADVRTEATG